MDIPPIAITISQNAARITAIDGTKFLNIINTVIDMKRKANPNA